MRNTHFGGDGGGFHPQSKFKGMMVNTTALIAAATQ
jgi:hypothetical protein